MISIARECEGNVKLSMLIRLLATALAATSSFAASPAESLIQKSQDARLSESTEWLRLVHYQRSKWGGYHSPAEDLSFFTSPDGPNHPAAELESTLLAFYTPVTADHRKREIVVIYDDKNKELLDEDAKLPQHPICHFPARLAFLKRELNWDGQDLPKIDCTRFENFKKRLAPGGVSLVFSSFFLGSPSSTFGHTLL
ncbi:MAG: DUF4105 domain-containing protein, partial [Proteobacteria bacterium]